jgi:16S rRNA (uracil1498-N3)-methyltransferase
MRDSQISGSPGAALKLIGEVEPAAPESRLELTLAAAVYKSDKLDLVIQKAVELGVSNFIPVISFRSEAKLRDADQASRSLAQDRARGNEAMRTRSRHARRGTSAALGFSRAGERRPQVPLFRKRRRFSPEHCVQDRITALVGPKGGWEDSEIDVVVARGFIPVKLGRRILRAETAAISFAAVLQHRFGDLN